MEQGNRLGIAGITSSHLPGVILSGNQHICIVLPSQHECGNITTYKRILGLYKYTSTELNIAITKC